MPGNLPYYAIVLIVVAIVAALLGFGGVASTAMGGAHLLIWVAVVILIVGVVFALVRQDLVRRWRFPGEITIASQGVIGAGRTSSSRAKRGDPEPPPQANNPLDRRVASLLKRKCWQLLAFARYNKRDSDLSFIQRGRPRADAELAMTIPSKRDVLTSSRLLKKSDFVRSSTLDARTVLNPNGNKQESKRLFDAPKNVFQQPARGATSSFCERQPLRRSHSI